MLPLNKKEEILLELNGLGRSRLNGNSLKKSANAAKGENFQGFAA
jgi:hypothetical protein